MNLLNPDTQSVATYFALSGPNDIVGMEASLAAADEAAVKLRALPRVARVTTLSTFVPEQQNKKLPLIEAAATALDPALNPTRLAEPPSDAEIVAAINSTIDVLNKLVTGAPGVGADAAHRLSAGLVRLANADPAARQRAGLAFAQPLHIALDDLRDLLKAHEITLNNLPADVVAQWITPDGRACFQVTPSGDASDGATLRAFSHDVQRIEPNSTEGPSTSAQ